MSASGSSEGQGQKGSADTAASSNSSPGLGMKLCIFGIQKKFPTVKTITTDKLLELYQAQKSGGEDSRMILLDVRAEAEYNISHMEGSMRVDFSAPVDDVLQSIPQLKTPGKKYIVCYCSVGYRSSILAQKLDTFYTRQDSTNKPKVYNVEGSLFKWANEGRPMVDINGDKTIYAHPYDAIWKRLLNKELRKTQM